MPCEAFLRALKGREIGIIGEIGLYQAKPVCVVFGKNQIKVEWKTVQADSIDYLNGVVNDKYCKKLGLTQPLSNAELQEFKAYLDQNVEHWEDKDSENIWKFVPKFLQTNSDALSTPPPTPD